MKAVIGFWYNGMYCGEAIVTLENENKVTNQDVENARKKNLHYAEMVDREKLPYIPKADFKVYNIF